VVVIGPVTEYFIAHSWRTRNSFGPELLIYFARLRFLSGTGPLWFCVALIVFSIGYVVLKRIRPGAPPARSLAALPGASGVALAVAAIAAATFLVRLVQPVGTDVYNMQLGYFASYVIMFGLGIVAGRRHWLERIEGRFAWRAAALCVGLAAILWLPILLLGGAFEGQLAAYDGGLTWQAAAMASWESLVCVGMSFAVLAGFRACAAASTPLSRFLSANAFAVYVIHPPVLILTTLALSSLAIPAVPKFALLWVLTAILCFGLAAPLARRVPVVGRILD
jgi:hypothetical protein